MGLNKYLKNTQITFISLFYNSIILSFPGTFSYLVLIGVKNKKKYFGTKRGVWPTSRKITLTMINADKYAYFMINDENF